MYNNKNIITPLDQVAIDFILEFNNINVHLDSFHSKEMSSPIKSHIIATQNKIRKVLKPLVEEHRKSIEMINMINSVNLFKRKSINNISSFSKKINKLENITSKLESYKPLGSNNEMTKKEENFLYEKLNIFVCRYLVS